MLRLVDAEWCMTRRPTEAEAVENGDPLLEAVGAAIRAERRRRKLTQQELAEKSGIRQTTVWAAETGSANLTLKTLQKIADAMGLEVGHFLPGGGASKSAGELVAMATLLAEIEAKMEVVKEGITRLRGTSPDDTKD